MSENTNVGPEGPTSKIGGIKVHTTYSPDRKGRSSVTGNGTGPEDSVGVPAKIVNNVKGSDK
jgi:hypothetical protein